MCAENKDSTNVGTKENEKEHIVESSETVDSLASETQEAKDIETEAEENTAEVEEIVITGKGYHRKLAFLHLVSMGFIWLLLRFTFMSSVEPELLTVPVWIGSVLLTISIHMLTFKGVFQTLAETDEILALMEKHTTGLSYDEPLTRDNYCDRFTEMLEHGKVVFKDDSNSVQFDILDKGKKVHLLIKH